jgi:hypothetical protein
MNRPRTTLLICLLLSLSIGFAPSQMALAQVSPAQKLVSGAPDNVLGFIATSGGDSIKPAFDKTVTARLWRDPGVQSFIEALEEGLLGKLTGGSTDPEAAKAIETVRGSIRLALTRPIIIGVAQKEAQGGPPIYGFAMLDAGPRKAEIVSALAKLEAIADEGSIVDVQVGSLTMHGPKDSGGVPGYWGWAGDHLVFSINDGTGLAMTHLQGGGGEALGQLQKVPAAGDALVIHLNREKIFDVLDVIAKMQNGEEELGIVKSVIKELGLNNLKTLTARMGFEGSDTLGNSLLEIPQPRTGLFSHLKPINLEMFDAVDAGAMSASAFNCDVAGVYDTVMKAIKTVAGEDFTEVEQGIAEIEEQLQIKIRDGLLKSLDGPMVVYSLPAGPATGSPQGAFALVAKLKDAEMWEKSITTLGQFVAASSDGMVQVSSQDQEGKTLHTWTVLPLAMAQIMPCWCAVGDKVVIASNPTFLKSGIDQLSAGKASIRSTEGFKKAAANLPDNLISFRYDDAKVQFNQMMMGLQQFWPMATMWATKAGFKLPVVLPNLSHIAEYMGPAYQYSWFDDQGIRSHSRSVGL